MTAQPHWSPVADSLTAYLATLDGRCAHGWHRTQGCPSCAPVAPDVESKITAAEWATFVAALEAVVRADGTVHQTDMRPRIASIFHKHRGPCYTRAQSLGLIERIGKEPSTDAAGRNTDKDQKVYRLLRVAVAA